MHHNFVKKHMPGSSCAVCAARMWSPKDAVKCSVCHVVLHEACKPRFLMDPSRQVCIDPKLAKTQHHQQPPPAHSAVGGFQGASPYPGAPGAPPPPPGLKPVGTGPGGVVMYAGEWGPTTGAPPQGGAQRPPTNQPPQHGQLYATSPSASVQPPSHSSPVATYAAPRPSTQSPPAPQRTAIAPPAAIANDPLRKKGYYRVPVPAVDTLQFQKYQYPVGGAGEYLELDFRNNGEVGLLFHGAPPLPPMKFAIEASNGELIVDSPVTSPDPKAPSWGYSNICMWQSIEAAIGPLQDRTIYLIVDCQADVHAEKDPYKDFTAEDYASRDVYDRFDESDRRPPGY